MLTFEEFFIKKKIDLSALQKADASLFFEFQDHYEKMGEKSFDHTKKFWFNQLRKIHPLAEEAIVSKKETNAVSPAYTSISSQEQKTVAESTTKPAGFKPRFKAPAKTEVEQTIEEKTDKEVKNSEPAASKPAGFQPRFKVGVTKSSSTEESKQETPTPENIEETTSETVSKPAGFKPRFKAGVTKTSSIEETKQETPTLENIEETTSEPISKPAGFKPRFKVGVTKSSSIEETKQETPTLENIEETTSEPVSKPAGFKPRFKARVTKTKPSGEDNSQ